MPGTGPSPPRGSAPLAAWVPRGCILLAAILWSTSGWFAKHPVFDSWPLEEKGLLLAFWRAFFAGACLLPFVRRPRWRWRLVPMTLSFSLMNVTYLSAMALTTAANAIWLQSTAPLWVFLIGLMFLREKPVRRDLVLLAFGMLGVGTILAFEFQADNVSGVVLGLFSGVFYGGVVLFIRNLREENAIWLVSLNLLVTAALLFPYIAWLARWPDPQQFVMLACFGVFQMGVPYVLFAYGLKSVSGQEAAGIALLEPILVPVWVLAVEIPAPWTLVGGGFILTGLVVRYLGGMRSTRGVSS